MNKADALEVIKSLLPEKRFLHTLGVLETAIKLAEKYQVDTKKAELAAIFHDYAKYHPITEMKEIVKNKNMDERLLTYGNELLHGPVGAYLVKKEYGITDEEILNAIRYHTTGRLKMTLLDKIIFISDYIEPNRSFTGVEEVRALVNNNLDAAIIASLSNTINFLTKKRQPIHPDTLATYNELIFLSGEKRFNSSEM
jgi:predicted HD superfamily hydrolase involved in NAD metabolism